ncbi:MAG: tyrosine--tRNA ligase [Candidatus Latescibacterota bacterium]|jgi:tyrosyl-tRNA synthetase|nr:tyrosine--tRNA ligase [Candidatus Latescibacterota bacterium]MEE2726512.1 tyrosine--tRNA ligase [Candidatus Latescibacterota bacterium]
MDLLTDLEFRGQIYQNTDSEGLAERLAEGPITAYCGFDPTADSMTVGNLATIMLLCRVQRSGHRAIALVGGGTGLIGDPSGKSEERSLNTGDTVAEWSDNVRGELERFLDFDGSNPALVVNNYDWLGDIQMIEFMRDVGKHFPISYMLAKDSVDSRLQSGISYTEFSYMVLQAYDFLKLNEAYDCQLQIGGSDQWGNITAGIDLIRRSNGNKTYGLTGPLVTKADGTKFGKSEGGAVWLDAAKTSPYEFWQFWINAEDQKVIDYLKVFTFLEHDAIRQLEESVQNAPEKREAQRTLADEVTALVHSKESAQQAERISHALFYGEFGALGEDEILQGFHDVPTHSMETESLPLVDLLVEAKVCSSKREARQDVQNGAIYINGDRCTELDRTLGTGDGLHGKYLIIRRGKKKYTLVQ